MAVEVFHGSWQIVEIVNISNSRSNVPAAVHGAIFVLKENGDIDWILGPDIDAGFPLFQCNCYEVVHTFVGVCIQMGALSGHIFEFWVDRPVPRDLMLLTFEGWCMLQCHQIPTSKPPLDFPFSFLPALTEGYFSNMTLPLEMTESGNPPSKDDNKDLVFGAEEEDGRTGGGNDFSGQMATTNNGREFKVHSLILEFTDCDLNLISKLSPEVLEVVLIYLYSQSLPPTLSEDLARLCISQVPKCMISFAKLCEDYIHRTIIKNKIMKLVSEVHACADMMAVAFRDHVIISPTRFCYVTKRALRDGAVACLKLVELCVVYGEESPALERNESVEILRYAKTRLPIFLNQFVALLRNIKNDFSTVKPSNRHEIASHVAPQIETLLEALSNLTREGKDACNEIWVRWSSMTPTTTTTTTSGSGNSAGGQNTSGGSSADGSGGGTLSEALYGIFRKREVLKLHQLQAQLAAMYLYLSQKKANFEEMTTEVKVRCVSRNLEQLIEELPVFLLRLEEIMGGMAFDDRFQWKDFKFCLQLAISQVCQTVQHLRKEKHQLQKFLLCLSELVHRDEFHQSLINLGLLEIPGDSDGSGGDSASSCDTAKVDDPNVVIPDVARGGMGIENHAKNLKPSSKDYSTKMDNLFMTAASKQNGRGGRLSSEYPDRDLNLFENLCTPRVSKNSFLAKSTQILFETKTDCDMVFEIPQDGESVEIPAHRVIVAARCDWIRRALLSGMKESIQKRIVIHDCSVTVFQLFLRFIYCGQICTDVTLDILSDLIALADRYEMDILKLYCEQELSVRHLDEASVIFLLSMADQYNARTLRCAAMEYITANPGIMAKEMFEELSPELQMEAYDRSMWHPKKVFSIPEELFSCPRYLLVPDSPSDDDSTPGSPPQSGI